MNIIKNELNNKKDEVTLQVTKEELNIIHNAVNYTCYNSSRNNSFSNLAKEQYRNMLNNLENIQQDL